MKAVVSLTFPDGKTWQARFTPGPARMQEPSTAVDPASDADEHAHHH
jgi:hypothetical protein